MKKTDKALASGGWVGQSAAIAILFAASVIQGQAQSYTLSTPDTSIQINLGGATPGLSDWTVDGVNQLDYQWFYYSVGSSALNSIDTIAPWTAPTVVNSQ